MFLLNHFNPLFFISSTRSNKVNLVSTSLKKSSLKKFNFFRMFSSLRVLNKKGLKSFYLIKKILNKKKLRIAFLIAYFKKRKLNISNLIKNFKKKSQMFLLCLSI